MPKRRVPRLARRIVAVVVLAGLARGFGGAPQDALPPGTARVVTWIANHDMVDVPYVRDCHGIFRHPDECPAAAAARNEKN